MNTISINQIAKFLNVRPVRLLQKVQQFNICTIEENEVHQLTFADAKVLVSKYVHSNRTNERTKNLAEKLMVHIDTAIKTGKPINLPFTKNNKKIVHKKNKPSFSTSAPKRDTTLPYLGTENVQLFFKTCVHWVQSSINFGVQSLMSVHFKFVALLVAIFVQMQHSAIWFYRMSSGTSESWLTAYAYAFMVDLFILVITLEGKMSIAKTFAVLTFFSNILYFQFWVNFDYSAQSWTNAISGLMISGIMAYIIFSYTEIFVKTQVE